LLKKCHWREWTGLVLAIAVGPVWLEAANAIPGLIFRAAAGFYILVCLLAVPLIVLLARRLKFIVWQISIVSLAGVIILDDLRSHAVFHSEIPGMLFVFWTIGTLFSSPLPIYFFLKPMNWRARAIWGVWIVTAGIVIWLGMRRITG